MNALPTPFQTRRQGILFVLSAPSGAGKSTLLHRLRPFADFQYSVSCTTRQPRAGELDGKDYHFRTRAQFETEIAADNLLEWAEVYGNYYGTPKDRVVELLQNGTDVLVDVDVQGARSIRASRDPVIQAARVDVFLAPPSFETLNRRLRSRGTESEEQLSIRLQNAAAELACWQDYAYLILSGSPEEDLRHFRSIMEAERLRGSRLHPNPTLP